MVSFSTEPIDPHHVYDMLGKDAAGSALIHFAVAKAAKNRGRVTTHITYEPDGEVERELRLIEAEIAEKWNITDVLLLRRQGMVAAGEIISVIAVSSPGSEAAFAACQFGLERMKKMSTIIKTEILE
ncbi:MAG TPA: molybdenum cofactor biosynthesis protein MoaE [Geobacteraceae bacterium]|nr:molybdenum cofactor biosynthesis protein MoaE [Geobacteraceae bacterium]